MTQKNLRDTFIFFSAFFLLFSLSLTTKLFSKTIQSQTKVNIFWVYRNINDQMKLYEISSSKPTQLWEMGNAKKLSEIPIGKEIQDSTLYLETNKTKRFVLVMKNNSPKPLHFFAAPHELNPPEFSFGFKFKCLCMNHVYKIDPGKYWYRVVEIHIDDNLKNKEINVTHDLIKVDS